VNLRSTLPVIVLIYSCERLVVEVESAGITHCVSRIAMETGEVQRVVSRLAGDPEGSA